MGPGTLSVYPGLAFQWHPSSRWTVPPMSSTWCVDKEKVGGWGSSKGCQKSIEMLILLVFLRENTKSTPGKKEAKERGRLGLQEKGRAALAVRCHSCVASWRRGHRETRVERVT